MLYYEDFHIGQVRSAGDVEMGEDEIIKNMFSNYAFEHYEIAAYKSLARMAQELGFEQAKALLEESRREEQRMAAWIEAVVEQICVKRCK